MTKRLTLPNTKVNIRIDIHEVELPPDLDNEWRNEEPIGSIQCNHFVHLDELKKLFMKWFAENIFHSYILDFFEWRDEGYIFAQVWYDPYDALTNYYHLTIHEVSENDENKD